MTMLGGRRAKGSDTSTHYLFIKKINLCLDIYIILNTVFVFGYFYFRSFCTFSTFKNILLYTHLMSTVTFCMSLLYCVTFLLPDCPSVPYRLDKWDSALPGFYAGKILNKRMLKFNIPKL